MIDFTDLHAADDATRLMLIEHWDVLPEAEREEMFRLGGLGVSPVDRLVKSAELIYAAREAMPGPMKEVAAGVFRIASAHGFYGLAREGRGTGAAKVLDGLPVPAKDVPDRRKDLLLVHLLLDYQSTTLPSSAS